MSYILDALRRADAERERGAVPSLHAKQYASLPSDEEPRVGVSFTFDRAPPLQIRQHAKLPNGDYIVTIDILQAARGAPADTPTRQARKADETSSIGEGLQTNIERRVSLAGGEALIALAVDPREPSVSE